MNFCSYEIKRNLTKLPAGNIKKTLYVTYLFTKMLTGVMNVGYLSEYLS